MRAGLSLVAACSALATAIGLSLVSETATVKPLSVIPDAVEVGVGDTQAFRGCREGRPVRRVAWAVNGILSGDPAIGRISPTGLYTAPSQSPRPPRLAVTAWDPAAPGVVGTAILMVRDVINVSQQNAAGDLSGVNLGDAISLGWAAPPEATTSYVAFRAPGPDGSWTEAARFERVINPDTQLELTVTPLYTPGVNPATDGFYRLEARAADGAVLRRYAPVFVPRYVDERLGRPEVTPGPRHPRCPPAWGSGAHGKGVR